MDSQYRQQYDTINSVNRIAGLLNASVNSPIELRLSIGQDKELYASTIIKVDTQKKQILIRRLRDVHAHTQLLLKRTLRVYFHINGADVSFTSKLLNTHLVDEQSHYVIAFPNNIKYRQRRSAFRVHVSLSLEVTASFKDTNGQIHIGQLRDISASGMKVQFTRVKASAFQQHAVVPYCTLSLPGDTDIHCTFRVRHVQENQRNTGFTMGGNFVALEQQDKRTIERFIASLERQSLRVLRN